jgi:excisionase family DNA binding protein
MQVITMTTEAYQHLIDKIDAIAGNISDKSNTNPLSDKWLDIQEVCLLLKISKRTLQSYRDNGTLPFSQVSGKIYFKASDIEKHLENHYKPNCRK